MPAGRLEVVMSSCRVDPRFRSASGRLVGCPDGTTLEVRDLGEEGVLVERFADAGPFDFYTRIALHGRRMVSRGDNALELREGSRPPIHGSTPTIRIRKKGEKPATPKSKPFELVEEDLGFTDDGRHVWLVTHDVSGRPCIQLYDDSLHLIDEFTDVRNYSPYERGDEPFVPIRAWSELRVQPQRHAPAWVLGYANRGDSLGAIFAFRVEGGRLVVEQELISRMVLDIDAYGLTDLQLSPRGELVISSRDRRLSVLAWPPPGAARIREKCASEHLRDAEDEIVLPFHGDGTDLSESALSFSAQHAFVQISHAAGPAALLVLDAKTLEPCDLLAMPVNRGLVEPLGNGLFHEGGIVWRYEPT